MEQSNQEQYEEEKIYDYTKSFINRFGAMFFIVLAVILIILVGSLTGFKEVKAKKSDSSRMLKDWREQNETLFPEEYIDIIKYDGKDYYFVIDKMDDSGKIVSWHFAYDSDLTYVFKDSKYWILTVLTIGLSLSVYRMNAQSTLRKVQDSDGSQKTRMVYAKQKSEIMDDVEYLDYFLEDEFDEIYNRELRSITNVVNFEYDLYIKTPLKDRVPKWYNFKTWRSMSDEEKIIFKKLKIINKKRKKISIQKLRSQDVIQDNPNSKNKKIILLSDGADAYLSKKMRNKLFSQILMTLVSGLTVTFGIALGDWTVGIAYGFTIVSSGITAIIMTTDYARTTLRQRDVSRTNILKKYQNKIPYYKDKYETKIIEEKEELFDLVVEGAIKKVENPVELNTL